MRRKPSLAIRFSLIFMTRNILMMPRYLIIGTSRQGRLLIVSYTERAETIRLISARELSSTEREAYEEN